MNRNRVPVFVLLVFSLVANAAPVSAQNDKVDEYVRTEMEKQRIPGLAIAVIRNGEIIKAQGFGLANIEHNVPVKPETVFQSGSVGKQFTAMAAMILVEEGKLNLDDKISKYFDGTPEAWGEITVRHLLTHTAGTTDYPRDFDFRKDYSEDELLKRAMGIPLAFQPGEKWSYSNLGYVVLGILISKVSGKFYGDFLKERVLAPLGMTTARIINEADIIPNRAAGYRLVKGEIKNQNWVSPVLNTTADGSLYFTVLDMAKWDAALYTEKLIKKASFDLMWSPVKLNGGKTHPYGFGWALGEVRGHRIREHGGAWQGFTAYIARYVDDKFTVIVLTNRAGVNPGIIAKGVAALYVPELQPVARKEVAVDPKIFDEYVGKYELTPGFILTVTKEENKLMAQATGQPKVEIFAESPTRFFFKAIDAQITFVKNDRGEVKHLIFNQGGGGEVEARKVN
jgi:CubicO group peptidase (beta-lactamase class C family)